MSVEVFLQSSWLEQVHDAFAFAIRARPGGRF